MYELSLFAGAGGGILGGILCGHTCVGACEIEKYPRDVLLARQRDGLLPRFPIWDDIKTFRSDNPECAGYFDYLRTIRNELVITGGFPCQDISAAGKGAGITGERSGLWKEFGHIIGEIRPARVLVENSPMLTIRGFGVVLGDLAEMGYDARWGVLGADDAGAPHRRKRIWIMAHPLHEGPSLTGTERKEERAHVTAFDENRKDVANAKSERLEGFSRRESGCHESRWITPQSEGQTYGCNRVSWWDQDPAEVPDSDCIGLQGKRYELEKAGVAGASQENAQLSNPRHYRYEQWLRKLRKGEQATRNRSNIRGGAQEHEIRQRWPTKPAVGRVAHGVAKRVDRLKAIGNGQVSEVVRIAWDILN